MPSCYACGDRRATSLCDACTKKVTRHPSFAPPVKRDRDPETTLQNWERIREERARCVGAYIDGHLHHRTDLQ